MGAKLSLAVAAAAAAMVAPVDANVPSRNKLTFLKTSNHHRRLCSALKGLITIRNYLVVAVHSRLSARRSARLSLTTRATLWPSAWARERPAACFCVTLQLENEATYHERGAAWLTHSLTRSLAHPLTQYSSTPKTCGPAARAAPRDAPRR